MQDEEKLALRQIFDKTTSSIVASVNGKRIISDGDIVISRYYNWPHYQDVEYDLSYIGAELINSYQQHCYIANFDYYYDIVDYTPKTWFDLISIDKKCSFIVKGRATSKKFNWNTHMFAKDFADILNVSVRLYDDPFISDQGLIYREYVPLQTLDTGVNGIRFTNEWRVFCLGTRIVKSFYYWGAMTDVRPSLSDEDDFNNNGLSLIRKVMPIISRKVNFYVVDVAKTESGEWIVIEVNDGQSAGLNGSDPLSFYASLKEALIDSEALT